MRYKSKTIKSDTVAKRILNFKPKINFTYDIKKSFENIKDQK